MDILDSEYTTRFIDYLLVIVSSSFFVYWYVLFTFIDPWILISWFSWLQVPVISSVLWIISFLAVHGMSVLYERIAHQIEDIIHESGFTDYSKCNYFIWFHLIHVTRYLIFNKYFYFYFYWLIGYRNKCQSLQEKKQFILLLVHLSNIYCAAISLHCSIKNTLSNVVLRDHVILNVFHGVFIKYKKEVCLLH